MEFLFSVRMLRITAIALLAAIPLTAAAQPVAQTEYVRTEIIPERDAVAPGGSITYAIRQSIKPGWHVFWINPGDAGLPLALDWRLPPGFEAGSVEHPVPRYIPVDILASYAHEAEAIFLVTINAPDRAPVGADLPIELAASWQVCEEICVPESATFSFSLPVREDPALITGAAPIFQAARAAMPAPSNASATIRAEAGKYVLRADLSSASLGVDAFFFPAVEGVTKPAAAQIISLDRSNVRFELEPGYLSEYSEPTLAGVIGFEDSAGVRKGVSIVATVEGVLTPPNAIAKPPGPAPTTGIAALLVFAFIGGMILNAMPCVFPIIFVKAATLMQAAAEDRAALRSHGLFYTGGVVTSFVAIGALLLLLRAGGEQLGWGFHLQSPAVVALSAYILLLVGLNLFGLFTAGENITGTGQGLAQKSGNVGAFFTGVLAVVVASPCIGPLLSAPLGAALVYPPFVGMLIFVLLAIGLAAPYLILSFAPALGVFLPRPGAWMVVMKKTLAFPVFAAAAYFVWVLSQQAGSAALGAALAGGVLIAFSAWLFEQSKGDRPRDTYLRALSAVAAVLALAPLTRMEANATPSASSGDVQYGALMGEAYSDALLETYLAAGKPVFIDFTAAWCVTCQIDKINVFSGADMAELFRETGARLLVADWTVRDPEITAALARYGASGVPLYVYYRPGGEAQILPSPLTKKALRKALRDK